MERHAALPPRDADGFLLDRSRLERAVATALAREEGLTLTPAHREILHMLRAYYREHEHAPAMRALVSLMRRTLGPDKGRSVYLLGAVPRQPGARGGQDRGPAAPRALPVSKPMHLSASPSPCPEEHPFAPFVRTLGRGRRGARSLERDEARTAIGMILDGEADPLQTGAFLMLLRVKEETAEEIAGFVQAARERATAAGRARCTSISTGRATPASASSRRGTCWRRCCWPRTGTAC